MRGAASASLAATDERDRRVAVTTEQRIRVAKALRDALPTSRFVIGTDAIPDSQTNFVWVDAGEQSQALSDALLDAGVVVRCFAGEGVRITVTDGPETDILLRAITQATEPTEPTQATQD